jgi:hypothetical protein
MTQSNIKKTSKNMGVHPFHPCHPEKMLDSNEGFHKWGTLKSWIVYNGKYN